MKEEESGMSVVYDSKEALSGTMFALAPESKIRDTFELVTEKASGAVMTVYDAN